ncbi:Os01g0737550, partial [Oryza sativa Japonica Group]
TTLSGRWHPLTPAAVLVVVVVQTPANLERGEGVRARVHHLLRRQIPRVPGAHPHVVRLGRPHAHHLSHQPLQPGAPQRRLPDRLRGEVAKVHHVLHLQPVMAPQLGHVVVDPDADEGEAAVGEEVEQRVRDVVRVEDLEDEAAAADADLEHGDGARPVIVGGGAPLDVEPDDEVVEAAAVDAEDLVQPIVDVIAGVSHRRVDVVLVERHRVGAVAEVVHDRSRHLLPSLFNLLCFGVSRF